MSYPKGQVAFFCGVMFLLGHTMVFAVTWANSSISPSAKSEITAMIVPLTAASVMSVVLYAIKHSELDLRNTPIVNQFFLFVCAYIPLIFFSVIIYGIIILDGDDSIRHFKNFLLALEAMFGGVFVVVSEALFGSVKEKQNS